MKQATIQDFLTDSEIELAVKLRKAKDICREIIEPNIDRINKALGQENNSMYLAYMVEYAINVANS